MMPRSMRGTILFLLTLACGGLSTAFPAGKAFAFNIQVVTSPGGIKAWLVEDHTAPVISIGVAFRGGYADDPTGKEGLAELTSGLLDEGAASLPAEMFQRRLADLAVDLSFDARADEFYGSMRVLSDRTDAAFNLLRLALTEPRFDSDAVDRIRAQLLTQLNDEREDPQEIAAKAWWKMNYPGHVYGRPPRGTAATLASITSADLRGYTTSHFTRDNLVIGVVGDIDAKALAKLLDETFGTLPATGKRPGIAAAEPRALGELVLIERDQPQSQIMFGQPGLPREAPDFYAAYLVNHILGGGGFSSRLTQSIREKRGLTYGIGTWMLNLDHTDLLQGSVATANENVPQVLALLREEWQRLADTGPTEQELADAKKFVIGSYPLRFTSSRSMAGGLVDIQLTNLPPDYVTKREDYINQVTLADVQRVAKMLLQPSQLSIVVVGKPEGLQTTRSAPALDE